MEITFTTKEESKQRQREEFLALSGIERIYSFLELVVRVNKYPTKYPPKKKDNFYIEIHCE